MEFKYTLTVDDFINFNIFHFKTSKTSKKSRVRSRMLLLIFYILFFIFFIFIGKTKLSVFFLVPISLYFIPLIIFWDKYLLRKTKKIVKKMLAEGKNKSFTDEQIVIFGDDKITCKDSFSNVEYSYKVIEKLEENEKYFFIYISSIQALILTKELFESENKMNDFRQFLVPKISGVTSM